MQSPIQFSESVYYELSIYKVQFNLMNQFIIN